MFFTGTAGIIIGGPLAIMVVSVFAPDIVGGAGPEAVWRGLTTVAGSWDVDTAYGPQDVIVPAIIHLGDAMTVDLNITIRDLSGKVLKEKSFPGIKLPAGRKTVKLAPVHLNGLHPGTVAVEYQLRQP